MGRTYRVAIIGFNGFQRSDERVEIECFPWNRVTNIANPSDYDAIVLDLISLTDPDTTVNWDGFFKKFTVLTTLEVLANSGNIVIIGKPNFWTQEPISVPGGVEGSGQQFLSWTGLQFVWDEKSGKTKRLVKRESLILPYLDYIKKISHWDYCLRSFSLSKEIPVILARVLGKTETQLSPKFLLERICENRYRGLIVFAIKLLITERRDFGLGDYIPETRREGRITFLPRIDEPQEEVVAMVLTGILRIQVVVPEPSWASAMDAPGQTQIDAKITQIKYDIAALGVELKNEEEERERARRCVHLLYKLGGELEDAVIEILGLLGSEVEPSKERGKEDGWLTVRIGGEIFEGVLEIKGTTNDQFSIKGLHQLMEWKKRGILNRKKKYKGIFVGNRGAEKEVSKREVPFTKSWTDTAELDEIVVLDTRDLYMLYCWNYEGHFDKNQFWRALFQRNGVFDISPFLKH